MTIDTPPPPYQPPPKRVRTDAKSDLHAYARIYAEMGWEVFPCRPRGKEPLVPNGFKDASTERSQIDLWWAQWPDANIGIATGAISGLVVVDVDPKNGGSLEQLALLFADEQLPPTKIVETGGGGWHLYFRQNDGDDGAFAEDESSEEAQRWRETHLLIPCTVGKVREGDNSIQGIAPGIDTRGEGGYVIAPPSIHPEGPPYLWERASKRVSILGFPANLTALLIAHKSAGVGRKQSVVGSAPTDEKKVSAGRNNFLTTLAGRFRADGFAGEALYGAVWAANIQYCDPPLDENEVSKLVNSVLRYQPGEHTVVERHEARERAAAKQVARSAQASPAQAPRRAADRPDVRDEAAPLVPDEPLPDTLRLERQEREIVAAILAEVETNDDAEATLLADVATILRPRHLYDPAARCVYQAMFTLDLLGKPISLSLVDAQAKAGPHAEDYPGMDAVRGWMASVTRIDFDPYILSVCRIVEESARRRALVILSQQLHMDALGQGGAHPEGASALELAATATSALQALSEQTLTGERDLAEFVAEYDAQLTFWRQHAGQITGASSGLHIIDRQTNGIQPGDLWVIGGRASMGKTAYALTMLAHNGAYLCAPGQSVGIVTLEMSGKSLIHRMVGMASGYAPYSIMTGRGVDDTQVRASLGAIAQMPLHIMDATTSVLQTNGSRGTVTPEVIRSRVKAWQRTDTLNLLVVDYLQLLRTPAGMARSTREQQVAEMCAQMKRLAQECNIPVVLLAQLSRATESRGDRLPQMSDIRESGGVEQDADVILMLFRQSYYADRGITVTQENPANALRPSSLYAPGIAQVKIEKNRNGPVGVYDAYFDKQGMRYYDWDQHLGAPVDYTGQPVSVPVPEPPGLSALPRVQQAAPSVAITPAEAGLPRVTGAHNLNYDGQRGEWRPQGLPYVDNADDDEDEGDDDR